MRAWLDRRFEGEEEQRRQQWRKLNLMRWGWTKKVELKVKYRASFDKTGMRVKKAFRSSGAGDR